MRAPVCLLAAVLSLAGCALRPRYGEFVTKETTAPVKLQVIEKSTGTPVPGAAIEVGEFKSKLNFKTDAEGFFTLPVDKKLMDDNALIVITAPPGIGRTAVMAGPSMEPQLPPKYVPAGTADHDPEVESDSRIPYPEQARAAGVAGTVRLQLVIDNEGHVRDAKVLGGPAYGLSEAARDGIKNFKFKPATKGGEAVSTSMVYDYTFVLDVPAVDAAPR